MATPAGSNPVAAGFSHHGLATASEPVRRFGVSHRAFRF